jgi:hypothetical protein
MRLPVCLKRAATARGTGQTADRRDAAPHTAMQGTHPKGRREMVAAAHAAGSDGLPVRPATRPPRRSEASTDGAARGKPFQVAAFPSS